MSTERELSDRVRLWLREDRHEDARRALFAVLDEVPTTRQRHAGRLARRFPIMNSNTLRLGISAVVVVTLVLLGYRLLPGGNAGVIVPTTTPPTPTPVIAPSPIPSMVTAGGEVQPGLLAPGMYTAYGYDGTNINVAFTVPAGWTWNGRHLSKGNGVSSTGATIALLTGDVQVYADPCHWAGTEPNPPTGSTASSLIDALVAQPTRNATAPLARKAAVPGIADVWPGETVELSVPADITFRDCDLGQFRSWGPAVNAQIEQGPGQRDLVWAVDINSVRLVIDASWFPDTPPDVVAEINAILDSIITGHWG